MTVENTTPAEILRDLRSFFPSFGAMYDAIAERRRAIYVGRRGLGSVAAASELLDELRAEALDR